MNARTIEHLKYFLGKVCSVISTSINRSFDERIAREHFVIRIQEVTTDGIWGTHPYNEELVSFFNLAHVISIHEEVELDPNNPEHADMIKEYEKQTGKKAKSDISNPLTKTKPQEETAKEKPLDQSPPGPEVGFVDIHHLEKLAAQTRSAMEQYDKVIQTPFGAS